MAGYQRLLPYGVAIGSTAIALLLRLWLESLLSETLGGFFYLAILVSTWYGGFRPGFVTVILSTLAINYFFFAPRYQFGISQPKDILQLSIFLLVAVSINLLTSKFLQSKYKIQQLSKKLAEDNAEQLRMALVAAHMGMEMTQRIRRSLNLQEILQTTVDEVRQFLGCDRVTIFKFSPGWGGTIIVESVAPEWMPILPLQIYDPCIGEEYVEPFKQGLVTVKADIYNSGISPCHVEFLASLQVRANLVVPVFLGDELWGLLAAHHCAAPREWQSREIELLRQLGGQVSIAIQQAALFEQVQTELRERQQAEQALQQREATLRLFAQYAPAGIAMFNRDMHYVMASQRWVDDYHLESIASLIGRSHYEIFPEVPERWREIHQRCLAGAIEKSDQDLFVRADGTQQWIRWEVRPWYTPTHEIAGIIVFSEDITQRKQTEDALAKASLRIQTLFSTSFDGIVMLDEQGNVVDSNPRFAQMLGYTPQEITRLNVLDWDAQFSREELQQLMRDYIRLTSGVLETRHRRKDGSIYDAEISFNIVQWEGEILRFCVCRDISERKQAQIALEHLNAELEQRVAQRTEELSAVNDRLLETIIYQQQTQLLLAEQAQLLDLAHDTIITLDLNWTITFWNQGAEYMYGWKKAEALGKISHILLQTQFPQPLTEIAAELLETGYWEGELTNFSRDTRPVTVASRWVLQRDNAGKPIKILEINNDITGRKQIETALRESEEKFRQLAENIQAVFWITDIHNHQVLYISPAYEIIWQRSCESLYQNSLTWLEAIHPEDRQNVDIAYIEQMKTGQYDQKYRIIRPDASIRWIRDRAFPIKNESGEMIRLAGIAEDITEREHIEQVKREFISIVSHELRTPLTSIRAAMGLLQTGIYDHKPDKFKRMIEIAAIDSDRLVRLVNDILDLERLESGRAVLEKTTCQAADLIEQAVEGVKAIAKQQNITFNIHPSDAQVWAAADTIIQTLINLLGNAIKFSPADSTITVTVQQQTNCVLFQIIDQGRGIPADKLEAIFNRFQQVDVSDSRAKGGTGLGLAICRSIIEQHGGKIWAESKIGVGSTFYFTLQLPTSELR